MAKLSKKEALIQLEALRYPLFKLTQAQADLLVAAGLRYQSSSHRRINGYGLCGNVRDASKKWGVGLTVTVSLLNKISKSLKGCSYLHNKILDDSHWSRNIINLLNESYSDANRYTLRQVWINKLLKHNGYETI